MIFLLFILHSFAGNEPKAIPHVEWNVRELVFNLEGNLKNLDEIYQNLVKRRNQPNQLDDHESYYLSPRISDLNSKLSVCFDMDSRKRIQKEEWIQKNKKKIQDIKTQIETSRDRYKEKNALTEDELILIEKSLSSLLLSPEEYFHLLNSRKFFIREIGSLVLESKENEAKNVLREVLAIFNEKKKKGEINDVEVRSRVSSTSSRLLQYNETGLHFRLCLKNAIESSYFRVFRSIFPGLNPEGCS